MTVRISEDASRLLGVFYSQHGKAVWGPQPSLDGTHPIVYSAWDSHANYPTPGIVIDDVILNSPGVIPLSWLKVANITANSDGGANQQGTLIQMWTPNNSVDQRWNIQPSGSGASITSVQSGVALDGGANHFGTNPQMWSSNGTPDQQWVIQPCGSGFSITSIQSNLVLDGGPNQVGTNPQMLDANSTVYQQWKFHRPARDNHRMLVTTSFVSSGSAVEE